MPENYGVIPVNLEPAFAPESIESLGSKEKFWFQLPDAAGETDWLFKYPRPDTGEHWAEKIAAEVAGLLGISCARVELATFQNVHGSAAASFTERRWDLFHGNQLLERVFQGYNPQEKRPHQHTLANIWQSFERAIPSDDDRANIQRQFAEYLILDAIIGNTDRHHENWGLLREIVEGKWRGFLAPSYDHATSLGRDISDEVRNRRLAEGRVGHYAERGRGGIYWSDTETRPSPLELVRRAVAAYPQFFRPGLAKLSTLDEGNILEIVNRIPADWMTTPQRDFAVALMRYTLEQLRRLT